MGIGRMIERAGEAAAPLDGIRVGSPRNGYTAPPALPRACFDHEYRSLHRNVAGAVQGHLALRLSKLRSSQSANIRHCERLAFTVPQRLQVHFDECRLRNLMNFEKSESKKGSQSF
jgi:hypothetical protein